MNIHGNFIHSFVMFCEYLFITARCYASTEFASIMCSSVSTCHMMLKMVLLFEDMFALLQLLTANNCVFSLVKVQAVQFLADHTIGRAFGTLYRLSVVCL